jgi:hypothetical protein
MKSPFLVVVTLALFSVAFTVTIHWNGSRDPTVATTGMVPDANTSAPADNGMQAPAKLREHGLSTESENIEVENGTQRKPIGPELAPPEEITQEMKVEYVRHRAYLLASNVEAFIKGEVEGDLASLFEPEDILWLEEEQGVRIDVFWHLVDSGNASRLRHSMYSVARVAENDILPEGEPRYFNPSFFVDHMTMDEDPLKPFRNSGERR